MSIRVMSWVWEYAEAEGSDMLVLLSLADHAGDDGGCYPSMSRLAKRARLSLRGAQTAVRSLEKKGLIVTYMNAGPNGCNRYRVITTPATSAPRNTCTPQITTNTPANGGTEPPQHLHPNRKEPSKNRYTPQPPKGGYRKPRFNSGATIGMYIPPEKREA